jgi:myosin heavy subunit
MAKVQATAQIEKIKAETARAKEEAQMKADLIVEDKRIEADLKKQAAELSSKGQIAQMNIAWEREKHTKDMALKREEMAMKRQDEIDKHQAANFGALMNGGPAHG